VKKSSGGSASDCDALLEEADDLLARAHVMLDGWEQAQKWHEKYIAYHKAKTPNEKADLPTPGE